MQELHCEILVVGAGPAGASLAGRLAAAGRDVLLVDRLTDLRQAAFSSAALPLAALTEHGLPEQVVAARWQGWQLIGPGAGSRRHWSAAEPLGAVLDFASLRLWLVERLQAAGGRLRLGLKAVATEPWGSGMRTRLQGADGPVLVRSGWVVDASGQGRALIGEPAPGQEPLLRGVGLEWLVELPQQAWDAWAGRLSFCLGSRWVPHGYGWVFPMQPGRLKIGVCRLDAPGPQPPLGVLQRQLLERLLAPEGLEAGGAASGVASGADLRVLDRHGGPIRSTIRRREPHGRGRLLGLGDAVSTANLLGGEGIRHALTSARVLAELLEEELQRPSAGGEARLLRRYTRRLRRALGWRWSLSGRLAQRTWLGLADDRGDRRLERLLHGLESRRAEDLSALLFDYRFERYGLRSLPYALGWR